MIFFLADDEDEHTFNNSTQDENSYPENILQTAISLKSKNGWVWIGGIQGTSEDAFQAMDEAMSILKCRYAVVRKFRLNIFFY